VVLRSGGEKSGTCECKGECQIDSFIGYLLEVCGITGNVIPALKGELA
jgi:hypothetical protein